MPAISYKIKLDLSQQKRWENHKLPDETLASFIKDAVDDYCLSLQAATTRRYARRVAQRVSRMK